MDFILNGNASGSVASRLMEADMDPNALRPYRGRDGRTYITQNRQNDKGEMVPVAVPVANAAAALRYEDWRLLDSVVVKVARLRLRLVADLRSSGLQYTIPNGMAKTVLSSEYQTDPGSATISMDGLRKSENDRPEFTLVNLPLPIIHSDFSFPARQVMVSRQGGSPLDTTGAEAATRRVAEAAEQLAMGTYGSFTFGGGSIYGLTNYPNRITYTPKNPTTTGWVAGTTVTDVLAMRQKSQTAKHFGPWVLYTSILWDAYLDADYILTGGNVATQTLRQRLAAIDGITAVKSLDYLTGYQMVLVQQSTDVIREVVGMDFTTVQWESEGGLQLNFKVMAILVPQLRVDANGNTGIVHASS